MAEGVLLGPLVLFAAAMSFTPGANVIMVTSSAASFGFRPVIPHLLGISVGFGAMVLATGLGLGEAAHAEPRLHAALKVAGAFYLLYLAWRIAHASADSNGTVQSRPIGFLAAVLFQLVNPKGWVSAVGGVATYTTAEGSVVAKSLEVTAVLTLAVLSAVTVWASFGTVIGGYLRSPGRRQLFDWSMAGLLVVSLVPVFW
jgi:threonine/homoserine/homoserine lactone efflux protein